MISENNMADRHLVVGSIEVLGDLTSGTTKEIRKTIEAVKSQALNLYRQQNNWWEKLSDDGVITPVEKNILYREMENIRRSEAAIYAQAEDLGYLSTAVIVTYINVYEDLRSYLYTDLSLFDDMSSDTQLPDRTLFNQKFSNYYYWESFVVIAINRSIIASLNFRVLESLEEEGEENEVALYKGGLYMWVDGAWKSITTGDYKGALTAIPDAMENAFFLAADNWTVTETLYINGEKLYVTSGGTTDELAITRQIIKGVIYYCVDNVWYRDYDERGYRYVAAFADVINVTGELPALFQDALDDLQDQIDDINTELGNTNDGLAAEIETRAGQYTIIAGDIVRIDDDILAIIARVEAAEGDITDLENSKISHLPVYYGATDMPPSSPLEGDYFVYSGTTTVTYKNSWIYRYHNNAWGGLDPENAAYRSYYMMALEDVLLLNNAGPGYFSALFANAFFSNTATMNSLATKTIYLRQGGYIQSDNTSYVRESNGMRIDNNGNIDANGDTHIAGKVAIGVSLRNAQGQYQPDFLNYDVIIGGSAKIRGEIQATSLKLVSGADVDGFADVATSGDYSDLNGTPNLADVATSGDYDDLTGTPNLADVATSGDYDDLTGTPNLADVATSGDYSDLSGTPNLADVATSGDYDDLLHRPTIPSVTDCLTESKVTHTTENGVEKVTVTTKDKNGNTSTTTASILDRADYLYLGKEYGSQDTSQHSTSFAKISKQGLLEADNAIIHGTIYATNGEFSGKLKAATGDFSGELNCGSLKVVMASPQTLLFSYASGTLLSTIYNKLSQYCPREDVWYDISELFPNLSNPVMTYGASNITVVKIKKISSGYVEDPYFYYIYFNGWNTPEMSGNVSAVSDAAISVKYSLSKRLVLKMEDLPNQVPLESGTIYALSDKILRIS